MKVKKRGRPKKDYVGWDYLPNKRISGVFIKFLENKGITAEKQAIAEKNREKYNKKKKRKKNKKSLYYNQHSLTIDINYP